MTYKELLIGCGSNTKKYLAQEGLDGWHDLTRLDINPDHKPDVLWDLTVHPLPFDDNTFDEIHAYQVLEHLAYQGDYEFFFREFTEYWRITKPNGLFMFTVPDGRWQWGDPSHKRVIMPETLTFLDQREYDKQVGTTSMSDFRYLYKADWHVKYLKTKEGYMFAGVLEAIK